MTEEFFAELATIPGWGKDWHGQIRRQIRQGKVVVQCDCPITAVANKRVGHAEYTLSRVHAAAEAIGLTDDDFVDIVASADEGLDCDARLKLLAACGLD